ncbi:protein GVQW3-like [Drosophila teissieri]|uniref:protein GVQW3-like n=1 Tax=Drosophila teissieri TaxID=7243 RepID=UPI001CB9E04E|nr:protein GVQW3-like [Drosophila teissieri]
MEFTNAEIRAILKFSFVKGKSARETFREINGVLGDGTLSLRTAEEWFRRFRAGENDTMDKPAGGRPVTTNTDQIMEYIELDRHVASRDIAQEMGDMSIFHRPVRADKFVVQHIRCIEAVCKLERAAMKRKTVNITSFIKEISPKKWCREETKEFLEEIL